MIKLILSGRAAADRPRDEAMAHLRQVHGPLVYDAPADAGAMPSLYVQNHVVRQFALPAEFEPWRWDRDLVTEISFEDVAHMKASMGTPYYLTHLKPDESRFVDHASVRPLVVRETADGASGRDDGWKLFIYLTARGDLTAFEAGWTQARRKAAPWTLAQAAGAPVREGGLPPAFVDGVWSLWFGSQDAAETFVREQLDQCLLEFGAALDRSTGWIVLAEEYPVSRLRRVNAASSAL